MGPLQGNISITINPTRMISTFKKKPKAADTITTWTLDPAHSEIAFKVKHLMITNVKGTFKDFGATVYIKGEENMTSEIDFWMNTASVDTNDEKRDEYLKGPEFFDAEKYKKVTFIGTSFEKTETDGYFILHGVLTMKNVTKRIELAVVFDGKMNDPWGNEKVGYTINGKINRKDWELNWKGIREGGGLLVSDEVRISCEVQLFNLKQVVNN
ncbi:MAG: YceI family protein [Saprospiraceae bacterium]